MASSSTNCPHDVFLSFRGEDIRRKFRSHFLKELDRKLITFKDDEMERGRSIAPELIKAIQGSRISVIAFSKNFADSSWCLDELVVIMKCRVERGLVVIPIFYEVDPSHVKKQSDSFGKIFEKTCEGRTEEQKLQWSKALTDAATITGEDSRNWSDEAKMIEKIVNDVSNKLISTSSTDFSDFVGIEDHIKKLKSLLSLKSEEVIMVGVWGPSGVGKTTIGRALFSQLSSQFLPSIFIDKTKENFTRTAESEDYNTNLYLQTQFLAEVLDQKDIKVHGLGAVEERLGHKRGFVVFDDMDDEVLLNALVGKTRWFGPRSRIVVISKDRELLRACGIESRRIYEVGIPSKELAFKMFCRCTFGQDSPPGGFMVLASEAVKLTGNLPLCINILGSSLAKIEKKEWDNRLPKLRLRMAAQIDKTLRDSYDRLKEEDKAIFRHIACLFNHKTCDDVKQLLEDSKLDVDAGLVTLTERCLIQISEDNIIRMHEFLQKIGREIVREPSIQEPGEREFLMESKEICDVLVDGTGTKRVVGIFLNLSEIKDTFSISEEAFSGMKNLRFLRINGVLWEDKRIILQLRGKDHMWRRKHRILKGKDRMWSQLRLLEWWGCAMSRMPSNFRAENLVELSMPDSQLEKLWEGAELLKNLKKVDLRRSKKLKVFPDLSKATNLEELCLEDCWSLVIIPYSICKLQKLRKLDMKRCKKLRDLPTNINLESLRSLNLSGCSQLRSIPQISMNLSHLFLDETDIVEVPGWIEDIYGLNYLLVNGCSNLKYMSSNISRLSHLEVMFCSNSYSLVEASSYGSPSGVAATTDYIRTRLLGSWENDVYVSFHGEDVGRTFVSHLNKEFKRKGINTYKEAEIIRGQDLATHLARGIRTSRIAVVVLSNNYASSTWCWDELVEIIKCGAETGQKMIPIFYGVNHAYIRELILILRKTFVNTTEKQQKLIQALTLLNQLEGYHTWDWPSEARMIEKIAVDISLPPAIIPKMLPMILDEETEEILKLQYKGLNENEKLLFRHIACFLNNETYEIVTRLLEDSELDVERSLKILCGKYLIQISEGGAISMHHVLQKLGRDIVLGPFIHQPAYRQILMGTWRGCDVLIDQTGTESVFGISSNVFEVYNRFGRAKRFKGVKTLKFTRMFKESLYGKEVRVHLVKGLHALRERLSNNI